METRQSSLLDILGDANAQFTLPNYQRNYSWKQSQCFELWRDVLQAGRSGQAHFAGMFICSDQQGGTEDAAMRTFEVIDGQQRLTTTFLMVLAFARFAQENNISFYGAGADYLLETFLVSPEGRKLTLSEDDRGTLFALIDDETAGQTLDAPQSRVLANYRYFDELMHEEGFDDEAFWKGLSSIYVIQIILDDDDDPQEVFESFNSKGVSLGIADMLRNHLLVAESLPEQERLYSNYWERVQSAFGDDPGGKRLGACLRAWVTVRCKNARGHNDREMFAAFKTYSNEKLNGRTEQCLKELVNFTGMWAERYRYHATKAYVSYNWGTLGSTTLIPDEVREKVKADKNSWYWQRYMNVDITI